MQSKQLGDGSWLVAPDHVNLHLNHLHLANDRRTVLSHKINGTHSYRLSQSRLDLSSLWEELTGEKGRFPGGFRS